MPYKYTDIRKTHYYSKFAKILHDKITYDDRTITRTGITCKKIRWTQLVDGLFSLQFLNR